MLARWSGWGALPDVFDPNKPLGQKWGPKVKEALGSDEAWAAARRSTINAHYTTPEAAEAIWRLAAKLGAASGGRALEPGCGPGVFMAAAPREDDGRPSVSVTGVELDPVTARLCQAAHPDQEIAAGDLRDFTGGGYDLAVGNVPFGPQKILDREITADDTAPKKRGKNLQPRRLSLHNYCLAKSLKELRPGGLLIAITSRYTLDAASPGQRVELARWGQFLGAVRLPSDAFRRQAGTDVVTDVVVFQRRPEQIPIKQVNSSDPWLSVNTETTSGDRRVEYYLNNWYRQHPEMILGEAEPGGLYAGDQVTFVNNSDRPLTDRIEEAFDALAARTELPYELPDPDARPPAQPAKLSGIQFKPPSWAREGSIFALPGGRFCRIVEGRLQDFTPVYDWPPPDDATKKSINTRKEYAPQTLAAMCRLRDTTRNLIEADRASAPEADQLRRELKTDYNRMRQLLALQEAKINGRPPRTAGVIKGWEEGIPLNDYDDQAAKRPRRRYGGFTADPDHMLLLALEHRGLDGPEPAALFEDAAVQPAAASGQAASLADALAMSMGRYGEVNLPFMRSVTGFGWADSDLTAEGLAFPDPAAGGERWIDGPRYLSGDVREKLDAAEAAGPAYTANAAALTAVLPPPLGPEEITVGQGTTLLTPDEVKDFICSTLRVAPWNNELEVSYDRTSGWTIKGPKYGKWGNSRWSTDQRSACQLLDLAWSGRRVLLTKPDPDRPASGNRQPRIPDPVATAEAVEKIQRWETRLTEWMFTEDPDRSEMFTARWNRRYRRYVEPQYPPEWTRKMPGLSAQMRPWDHQAAAAGRIALGGSFLLAHSVGAGKTGTMAMAIMRMRQLGIRNKPAVVVPNSIVTQFATEFMRVFPEAKLLTPDEGKAPTPSERAAFAAKSMWGDWDAVIIPQSFFSLLPMHPSVELAHLRRREAEARETLDAYNSETADQNDNKTARRKAQRSVKAIEKKVQSVVSTMNQLRDFDQDDTVFWEDLGVDYLFIDEAHEFKNLNIVTANPDLNSPHSKRAEDLLIKLDQLRVDHPGQGVATLATGTPVANKPQEIWVMMRYLMPEELDKLGMPVFDAWARAYTRWESRAEPDPVGGGIKHTSRLSKLVNVPELRAMINSQGEIRTREQAGLDAPDQVTPEIVTAAPTEWHNAYFEDLGARRDRRGPPEEDPNNVEIKLIGQARKIAVDLTLVGLEDDEASKVVNGAADIARRYHEWKTLDYPDGRPGGALQLVFCDMGVPAGKDDRYLYGKIAGLLETGGVPTDRIEAVHDYPTAAAKAELFRRCREGEVSVLLGSTQLMGQGVNVQTRLKALHHFTLPWKPSEMEQREGRIVRPGNTNNEVHIVTHITEGSADVFQASVLDYKDRFIKQFIAGQDRIIDIADSNDEDSYERLQAVASGDVRSLKLQELQAERASLTMQRETHAARRRAMKHRLTWRTQQLQQLEDRQTDLAALDFDDNEIRLNEGILTGEDLLATGYTRPRTDRRGRRVGPTVNDYLIAAAATQQILTGRHYSRRDPRASDWQIGTLGGAPLVLAGQRYRRTSRGYPQSEIIYQIGPRNLNLEIGIPADDVYEAIHHRQTEADSRTKIKPELRLKNKLGAAAKQFTALAPGIQELKQELSDMDHDKLTEEWTGRRELAGIEQKIVDLKADLQENPIEKNLPPYRIDTEAIEEAYTAVKPQPVATELDYTGTDPFLIPAARPDADTPDDPTDNREQDTRQPEPLGLGL